MTRGIYMAGFAMLASSAAFAFIPHTDHHIMNVTTGIVHVDLRSTGGPDITNSALAPGYGMNFSGTFLQARVRFPNGKVLSFGDKQLRQIHGGTVPVSGAWLIEDSGIRCVSSRDFNLAYRRFHKLWP
jgi:hypothetical protein